MDRQPLERIALADWDDLRLGSQAEVIGTLVSTGELVMIADSSWTDYLIDNPENLPAPPGLQATLIRAEIERTEDGMKLLAFSAIVEPS